MLTMERRTKLIR